MANSVKRSRTAAFPQLSNQRPLTCVDLFAGAGGFSLAAKNIGIRVVAAVEVNKNACKTYAANIVEEGVPHLYEQDIRELSPSILVGSHFREGTECDIVLGGPPCQGFSVHRINDTGINDPRNNLILTYFQFVRTLRPKVFLMENVPGLLWPRHKSFLDAFYAEGRDSGFFLYAPVTLDARDYGVPQRRKRVFVLGIRQDMDHEIAWPPQPTHGNEECRKKNHALLPWLLAAEVFKTPISPSDENCIHMNHSPALLRAFHRTPINGGSRKDSGRILPCHSAHDGHSDVYGRINPSRPGPTMTTACINPSKGRFVHPTEHHGITLRHAARFQTFPDSYVFKGGLMAGGQQVGNAVPIRLAEIILTNVKRALSAPED